MTIYIHHGAPGSYKTSGVLQDVVIPAALQGRTLVTNIRGLTRDRIFDQYPDTPETLDIIHIDTSRKDDREQLHRWFHWVPLGCMLVIDEAQSVWPKRLSAAAINKLDYPGGIDQATQDGRPHDWSTAFEMHRHYNWDIVCTCPNISLMRGDIRDCAELASFHRNQAHIGLAGRYLEAVHPADTNPTRTNFIGEPYRKRIKPETFACYDSTATGTTSDTQTVRAIWKDPKLLLAVGVLALALLFSGYSWNHGTSVLHPETETLPASPATLSSPADPGTAPARSAPPASVDHLGGHAPVSHRSTSLAAGHPLAGLSLYIDGQQGTAPHIRRFYRIEHSAENTSFEPFLLDGQELRDMGYSITHYSDCVAALRWRDTGPLWIVCARHPQQDRGGQALAQNTPDTTTPNLWQ